MDLKFVFGLDHKPLTTGIERCKGAIGDFKHDAAQLGELTKVGDALKLLGVSFAAFKSIEGIGEGLKSVFESGKALRSESKATGESITSLVALKKAYQEVGMDAGSLQQNLAMLQSALGGVNAEGEPTKHIFDQLGLSVENLKGQSAVEQFHAIGTAISGLATQADKMAAVKAIFGRQGAPMLNILADPKAIDEASKSTAEKAAILERDAALFTRVTNQFEAIGVKTQGIFLGMAGPVASSLEPLLDSIKKIDTIDIGKKIGSQVSVLTAAIGQGKFSDLMQKELDVVGMYGSNVMAGIVNSFVDEFAASGDSITATLLRAFEGPLSYFQACIETDMDLMKPKNLKAQAELIHLEGRTGRDNEQLQISAKSHDQVGIEFYIKDLNEASARAAQIEKENRVKSPQERMTEGVRKASLFNLASGKAMTADDFDAEAAARRKRGNNTFSQTATGGEGAPYPSSVIANAKNIAVAAGAAITAGIKAATPEESATPGTKSLEGWKAEKQAAIKPMDSDRLAKIGGFVGGSGPANDHARRTADAAGAILTWAQQVSQQGIKIMTQPTLGSQGGEAYA